MDLRDSFEEILKSGDEQTTGTEEEVSKMGEMWERRNANAPVCGDEWRGSCWRRRLSGLSLY